MHTCLVGIEVMRLTYLEHQQMRNMFTKQIAEMSMSEGKYTIHTDGCEMHISPA